MLISVIIPVYNKESGIKRTINSVISQSFNDFEIIIVDDGSQDRSVELIREFKDERIRIISQNNAGPSAARNHGSEEARGEWVVFLDGDDELEPKALETFYKLSQKHPDINCIACNFYVETNGVKVKRTNFYSDGIIRNNFKAWYFSRLFACQGSYALKRSVALKHPFPEYIRRWEDACMMFGVMREERILRCSKPVFTYHRSLSEASTRRKNPKEDFLCNLNPRNKSFWERMCQYRMYEESKRLYSNEAESYYGKTFDAWYIKTSFFIIEGVVDILTNIKHLTIG